MLRLICGKTRSSRVNRLLSCRYHHVELFLAQTVPSRQFHCQRQLNQSWNVIKTRPVEKILLDESYRNKFTEALRKTSHSSSKNTHALFMVFSGAIDMASSELAHEAYKLVLQIWEIVFAKDFADSKLQEQLLSTKAKVIHLMINRGDYAAYMRLIRPIYSTKNLGAQTEWADVLMSTLQLTTDTAGVVKCNHNAMVAFLRSTQYSQHQKRLLIATYVRKCMLYYLQPLNLEPVLLNFITFLEMTGDESLHLTQKQHIVYERALRLVAIAPPRVSLRSHIEHIQAIVERQTGDKSKVSLFVTSLLAAISISHPDTAVSYWEFKKDKLSTTMLQYTTPEDLLNVMWAYFTTKNYDAVLRVYGENPTLQHDNQITVLLKISDQAKDWKLLQLQFEDMYGRGQLPYVVHYVVVMNALASIGASAEVEQLYRQLLERNLTPTAPIFLALIKSKLNTNDNAGAKYWFEVFLKQVALGSIPADSVPRLQAEVFSMNFFAGDVASAMNALEDIVQQQQKLSVRFIDAKFTAKMIDFAASVYAVDQLDTILDLARSINVMDESVYQKAVDALLKFGQFNRADELLYEAHTESVVPFSSALITASQIKTYRAWFEATPDTQLRLFLAQKVTETVRRIDSGGISPRNMNKLLVEVIKHFVALKKLRAARAYLEQAQKANGLHERHFLPFLRHYCHLKSYEGHTEVLELYREMVKLKVPASAATYYYLIQSLIHMDKVSNTGFKNSYNLLESVFELYGFSMVDNIAGKKLPASEISQNAVDLLKIVSAYAVATSHLQSNLDIVVKFLTQIQSKLGNQISFGLRFAILAEMGRIYHVRGDLSVAEKLVNDALAELHDIIDTHKISQRLHSTQPVPKLLQIQYRALVSQKLQILRASKQPNIHNIEHGKMLDDVVNRNIRLSGPQFSELALAVLSTPLQLHNVFHVCEQYLVGGNWIEIKLTRKIQYIYKLLMVYLTRSLSTKTISKKYKLFNDYYNVRDFGQLQREFAHVQDPKHRLGEELEAFNRLHPLHPWTLAELLQRTPEFFVPKRIISTKNIIEPALAAALLRAVESHCDGDLSKAFALYDRFPETMEYLLYFGHERVRYQHFYAELARNDQGIRSANGDARRERALQALLHLQVTTEVPTY